MEITMREWQELQAYRHLMRKLKIYTVEPEGDGEALIVKFSGRMMEKLFESTLAKFNVSHAQWLKARDLEAKSSGQVHRV